MQVVAPLLWELREDIGNGGVEYFSLVLARAVRYALARGALPYQLVSCAIDNVDTERTLSALHDFGCGRTDAPATPRVIPTPAVMHARSRRRA